MNDNLIEKKVSSKAIFKGKIIDLYFDEVLLPNNKIATREKVTHPGAVGIVPIDNDGNLILIRQFRYPMDKILIEIPAGKLDKDEEPINCAKRELKEEIGAYGGKFEHVSTFYTSPGFCDELLYLYISYDFKEAGNNLDDDEFLEIFKIDINTALTMVNEKKIVDAKTVAGILFAHSFLNKKSFKK